MKPKYNTQKKHPPISIAAAHRHPNPNSETEPTPYIPLSSHTLLLCHFAVSNSIKFLPKTSSIYPFIHYTTQIVVDLEEKGRRRDHWSCSLQIIVVCVNRNHNSRFFRFNLVEFCCFVSRIVYLVKIRKRFVIVYRSVLI